MAHTAASKRVDVVVVGGGIVGLSVALRLVADGRQVTVLDPELEAGGAAYGSAGTIADYAVIPIGTPSVLRNLPALLLGRDSPLSICNAELLSLAPWLIRFAWQSLPANSRRNAGKIACLVAEAASAWRELAAEIGAGELIQHKGCLYAYPSQAAFRAAATDVAIRTRHGIAQELLSPDETTALEPALPHFEGGGLLFPSAMHLSDPGLMLQHLRRAAETSGVEFIIATAERIERTASGVEVMASGTRLLAKTVVVAAGARSKRLAAQAGDFVPLDTQRGYHIEFEMETSPLSRPFCPIGRGFYMIPMAGRLRVAGIVELGGLTAPVDHSRTALLERGARAVFPKLGPPDRSWMGFRPSMPDSVPVIRPSRGGRDIVLAFGHGHLGLTLAPVTGRIVSDIVAGRSNGAYPNGGCR